MGKCKLTILQCIDICKFQIAKLFQKKNNIKITYILKLKNGKQKTINTFYKKASEFLSIGKVLNCDSQLHYCPLHNLDNCHVQVLIFLNL